MRRLPERNLSAAMKSPEELMDLVHSGNRASADIPPIVLVVDDHEDTLELYDICLSAEGYWVARAANGLEALECAQDLRPDAIITDMALGEEMNGADLLRELRADLALREIPVLVVTGRGPRDLPSLAGLDTAGLLLKPVAPETLVSQVATVLRTSPSLLSARSGIGSHIGIPPAAQPGGVAVRKGVVPRGDKKRRDCPRCGTRLSWVETRRWDGVVCDYYRACTEGCGLFFYNRARQEWETLMSGDSSFS